jgi:hypothetical protein
MLLSVRPYFLNVDLEIESASSLDLLAAEMGERVLVLYVGPVQKHNLLAVESARQHKTPDAAILALCSAVKILSPNAKRLWNAARKEFDVGCEMRPSERSSRFTLRPATLAQVVDLGATLAVTFYQSSEL